MADTSEHGREPKPVKRTLRQALEEHAPWKPTDYQHAHALAMRRLQAGQASAEEQKLAFEWIVKCTGVADEPFRPGGVEGERDTQFALGKASVGRQIIKLVKIDLSRLKREGEHGAG